MGIDKILYKGIPLTDLSKSQLIEAVSFLLDRVNSQSETIHKLTELNQIHYTPKTWLGKLLLG